MPRVPNSARGKRTTRKKKDEMCAFDLLATVAGTLLADQDNSANAPNTSGAAKAKNEKAAKEEPHDEIPPLKKHGYGERLLQWMCSGFWWYLFLS